MYQPHASESFRFPRRRLRGIQQDEECCNEQPKHTIYMSHQVNNSEYERKSEPPPIHCIPQFRRMAGNIDESQQQKRVDDKQRCDGEHDSMK